VRVNEDIDIAHGILLIGIVSPLVFGNVGVNRIDTFIFWNDPTTHLLLQGFEGYSGFLVAGQFLQNLALLFRATTTVLKLIKICHRMKRKKYYNRIPIRLSVGMPSQIYVQGRTCRHVKETG
jgi:hypothetical protein